MVGGSVGVERHLRSNEEGGGKRGVKKKEAEEEKQVHTGVFREDV